MSRYLHLTNERTNQLSIDRTNSGPHIKWSNARAQLEPPIDYLCTLLIVHIIWFNCSSPNLAFNPIHLLSLICYLLSCKPNWRNRLAISALNCLYIHILYIYLYISNIWLDSQFDLTKFNLLLFTLLVSPSFFSPSLSPSPSLLHRN